MYPSNLLFVYPNTTTDLCMGSGMGGNAGGLGPAGVGLGMFPYPTPFPFGPPGMPMGT